MLSEFTESCQSSRSVLRAHRVVSEVTECPMCRGSRRQIPWFVEPLEVERMLQLQQEAV